MRKILIVLLLTGAAVAAVTFHDADVAIVANTIDEGLAGNFISYLNGEGITANTYSAGAIPKDADFIIILGGPDASQGVGSLVGEALKPSEYQQIRISGASKMFTAEGVWKDGQKVVVLAGYNRQATQQAEADNQAEVLGMLGGKLKLSIESVNTTLDKDTKWNIKDIEWLEAYTKPTYDRYFKTDYEVNSDFTATIYNSKTEKEIPLPISDESLDEYNVRYWLEFDKPSVDGPALCSEPATIKVKMEYRGETATATFKGIEVTGC